MDNLITRILRIVSRVYKLDLYAMQPASFELVNEWVKEPKGVGSCTQKRFSV